MLLCIMSLSFIGSVLFRYFIGSVVSLPFLYSLSVVVIVVVVLLLFSFFLCYCVVSLLLRATFPLLGGVCFF